MQIKRTLLMALLLAMSSLAFKTETHIAVANQAMDEMEAAIKSGNGGANLVFHDITLPVTNAQAIKAIVANETYFRMGSAGPDAFPDMATGQTWMHTNNGADNSTPYAALASYESRLSANPMESFRSIDYAMSMLKAAVAKNDDATLAFALGYLGHCVSDGFSHGWINQLAGDFFDLKHGSGLYGPISEEFKHIEIEAMIDAHLPPALVGLPATPTDQANPDRLKTNAPYSFLNDFYNSPVPAAHIAGVAYGKHMGGPVYDFWQIQETIFDKIGESATDMDNLAGLPDMTAGSIEAVTWIFGRNDLLSGLAKYGGIELLMQFVLPDLDNINPAHYYFSEVRANYHDLRNELKSNRRNWTVMSKCTAQNMITLKIADAPDNCEEVAASGTDIDIGNDWAKSTNQSHYRDEIIASFQMEDGGDSHSMTDNVKRAGQYLMGGVVVTDIPEVIIPAAFADGWRKFVGFLKDNDNILVKAMLTGPALVMHEAFCVSKGVVCEVGCTWDCVDKTANCIADRVGWCWSDDAPWCGSVWDYTVCEPTEASGCSALATTYCSASGVLSCIQCTAGCAYDSYQSCIVDPIKNWDNMPGLLAKDLDGISQAIDRIKDKAVAVVGEMACDAAKAQGVPVADIYRTIGTFKSMELLSKSGDYAAINAAFLAEDIKNNTWYNQLLNSGVKSDGAALLTSLHDGSFAGFSALAAQNPIDVPANCFDFSFDASTDFSSDPQFGLLATMYTFTHTPGPTAAKLIADLGQDPSKDFAPMYNAIQGNKLLGVDTKSDLEKLYTVGGVTTQTLQWSSQVSGKFSDICKNDKNAFFSIYCDVIPSLDDPNCIKCEDKPGVTGGARNFELVHVITGTTPADTVTWFTRKSLVPYNPYDPKNPNWREFDYTAFPLAATPEVVEKLYKKIFMVPKTLPEFMGFDDPQAPWTSSNANVSLTTTNKTQGTSALQVKGSGYMTIQSPVFNTTDFGVYSNQVSYDVWIPAVQPNPSWIGQTQLLVDLPAAGINNQYVGAQELTPLKLGAWNTVTFTLPQNVVTALAGDYPNMQFTIVLNVNATTQPFLLDNFRFVGDVTTRTTKHQFGSTGLNVLVPDIFSFDDASRWNSYQVKLTNDKVNKTQGTASMVVPGSANFTSVSFNTWQVTNVTSKLNVDVYVPDPQPNKWWLGALQLSFDCPEAGVYSQFIGQKDLTNLFRNEFNSVVFDLPAETIAALKKVAGGCTFKYSLNVNNGSGNWLFDNMGFINDAGVAKIDPVAPVSSSSSSSVSNSSSSSSSTPVGGFTCTGNCLSAISANNPYQTYTLGTVGETWYVLNKAPSGWQGSEMAGRTVSVNGVDIAFGASLPAAVNGLWYIKFSAGQNTWASWSWWP